MLRHFASAYATQGHHRWDRTYFRAEKGVGKTVLLDCAHDMAVEHGWVVLEENGAMPTPLSQRFLDQLIRRQSAPDPKASTKVSLRTPPLSVERNWERAPQAVATNLRDGVDDFVKATGEVSGVLFSVDEVHDCPASEFKAFANEWQHLRRDGFRVAFVAAGLPIGDLRDPKEVPTFLARSNIPTGFETVGADEIARAFRATVSDTDKSFSTGGLRRAVELAGGLPYAMQVVGWHAFEAAEGQVIDRSDVDASMPEAHTELATGLRFDLDVSPGRLAFLHAMCHDVGDSNTGDIGRRLGRTPKHLSPVRDWHLKHGYVVKTGHGRLGLAPETIRPLLRTHPAAPQHLEPSRATSDSAARQVAEVSRSSDQGMNR